MNESELRVGFDKFFQVYEPVSKRLNLVSYKTKEELYMKHFLDSANVLRFVDLKAGMKILDVGTGGGFPGLVLAFLCPQADFCLLDSVEKKLAALAEVQKQLSIQNVRFLKGRAEEFGRMKEYREKFDFVLARAVAPLPTLLEYCTPFAKVEGRLIVFKGPKYKDELEIAKQSLLSLDIILEDLHEYKLNMNTKGSLDSSLRSSLGMTEKDESFERYLLVFRKKQQTNQLYPREVGVPKNKPL